MTDFIKKLQDKPYEVRLRILWGTVLIFGVLALVVFVFDMKNTIKGVDGKTLLDLTPQPNTAQTATPYAAVERVEGTDKALKVYFNYTNPGDDILNVSELADITLFFENGSAKPQKITDRQNQPYVRKILSHTQNFGILVFEPVNAERATLVFDRMFMEKDPSKLFQQKLELDLKELSKPSNLRN